MRDKDAAIRHPFDSKAAAAKQRRGRYLSCVQAAVAPGDIPTACNGGTGDSLICMGAKGVSRCDPLASLKPGDWVAHARICLYEAWRAVCLLAPAISTSGRTLFLDFSCQKRAPLVPKALLHVEVLLISFALVQSSIALPAFRAMRHYHRKPLIPPPHLLVSSSSHGNDASPHIGSSHFSSHRDSHGAPATKSARPIRGAGWTTWMRQAAADFKDVVYWAQRRLDAMDEREADRSLLSGLKRGIGLNEVVEKVTEKGGWRAGAAFYTSLSHNLTLAHTTSACLSTDSLLLNPHTSSSTSTSPSPKSPPTTTMAKDATAQPPSQPHPSTLPKPTSDATPLTEPVPIVPAPPLSTYLATSPTTIISALKLIADSIAQQRQLASRALIFHPLSLSLFIGLLGFLTSIMYDGTNASLPLIFTTFAGICMACLVAVRGATAGYINAAEQLNLGFLKPEGGSIGGEADDILVTTYGDLVIGVLILRFPPGSGAASSSAASLTAGGSARKGAKKSQQITPTSTPKDEDKSSGPKTVLVRAWTVKMRYRGTGVGRALLEEGVKLARERCGDDVKVVFDKEHANSKKLLPGLFMAGFSGREERARKSLAKVVDRESAGERVGREPVPPAVEEGGEK